MNINVIHLVSGPIQNNLYIVYDETNKCVIIDAPLKCAETVQKKLTEKSLTAEYILLTHTHWDHIGDLKNLQQKTNAKVCVHKNDAFRLQDEGVELPIKLAKVVPDILLSGGEEMQVGNMKFRVLFTPGHTEGGICFAFDGAKIVFVGDTLFAESIGRTDFPGGDYNILIKSIKTELFALPDDFAVYCGHNETTTIGHEKQNNPFLHF